MPVEIKELIIRAVVSDDGSEEADVTVAASTEPDREALVQECVRQVLKILERSRER